MVREKPLSAQSGGGFVFLRTIFGLTTKTRNRIFGGSRISFQRTRAPYIGWSDETVQAMREWLKEHYPQFVYPEEN